MAEAKITLDELNRKIADPNVSEAELAAYFDVDKTRSGPFSPVLEFNPAMVAVPDTPAGHTRSAALLNSANFISRLRRQSQFHAKIASGTYKGPVIVSEGDSWFQYPFRLVDTIDHLMKTYAIFSLDAAGDTLSNMFSQAEYMNAIEDTGASIFLFSAGGNDVVAGGNLAAHLRDYDPSLAAAQHLLPSFETLLNDAIGTYGKIVRQVAKAFPSVHIVCHGYDYTIPASGPWLGKPMEKRGIKKPEVQQEIARVMIDRFNRRLATLAAASARLSYIDCRGTVSAKQWFDELHPVDAGYAKVAGKFATVINKVSATKAPAPAPATRGGPRTSVPSARVPDGPRGISLHIGLNVVDPAHYAGWDGKLNACEFDAQDMAELATGLGYETKILLSKQATLKAVRDAVQAAAKALKAGDIFFITYSGHGGQVPDFNGDEDDALDETWCLYNGQLIDDELYELWAKFAAGVRVLMLSDSCHSGSVARNMQISGTLPLDDEPHSAEQTPRVMPDAVAARTYRQNRDFYRTMGEKLAPMESRTMDHPVACSVRLISGCQDNQLSLDGVGNGAFTAALLAAWNHGRFKRNYKAFHKAIVKRMPATQTPNHFQVGAPDPIFDAQSPFAI